jgi:hypothetical protein
VIFNALDAKTGQNTDIIQLDKNDKRVGIASTQKTLTQESSFAVWYTNVARTLPQKKSQALTITKVTDKTVGDAAFTITASSNSGLSVITSVLGGLLLFLAIELLWAEPQGVCAMVHIRIIHNIMLFLR